MVRTKISLLLAVVCVMSLSITVQAATIYVPDDYLAIQDAIDAAASSDAIVVRPGTYFESIDFNGKDIALKSEQGPEVTTIDGGSLGSVVTFQSAETLDAILEGFTVTNGIGSATGGWGLSGGGIFCENASPTITGNLITGNDADYGGGGAWRYSSALITRNRFSNNTASQVGGGLRLYHSAGIVEENLIFDNKTEGGGGIEAAWCTTDIINNTITDNDTSDAGGGISCFHCACTMTGNSISGNSAGSFSWVGSGGGLELSGGTYTLSNNVIIANEATDGFYGGPYGGGIYCNGAGVTIIHCIIAFNAVVKSYASKGGGVYCNANSAVQIVNSILWQNSAQEGPEIWVGNTTYPSSASISYSDLRGGSQSVHVEAGSPFDPGPGLIDEDPLFVDAAAGDYHIFFDSPCRDTGDSSFPGLPDHDFEGDPRVAGSQTDMGVDEFHRHLYYVGTAIPGRKIEVKVVGEPLTAPITLVTSDIYSTEPLYSTLYGNLYLEPPLTTQVDTPGIPADGVRVFKPSVPQTSTAGETFPYQVLVGPEVAGSKLTNLMVITVE